MRLAALLFAASVALATPSERAAAALAQRDTPELPLYLIPSVCDPACATYKDVFSTCPGNPSAGVCAGVCNGTVLTDLQVCINCTLIEGPPAGVIQFEIDLLNKAQQQLAQACVEEQFPKSFSGTVPIPTTVAYPSGVINATFSPSGPIPTPPAATSAPASNSSGSSGSSGTAASASAPASDTATSGATLAAPLSAAAVLGALAVSLL